jgi:hypothetical protein
MLEINAVNTTTLNSEDELMVNQGNTSRSRSERHGQTIAEEQTLMTIDDDIQKDISEFKQLTT